MSNFEKETKKFSGKVKIADIEAEFTKLVAGINAAIDVINEALNKTSLIDVNSGSSYISGENYTLTCTALRKVLANYENKILLGGKCVEIDGDVILFPTLVVNDEGLGCTQIASQSVDTEGAVVTIDLYYDRNLETVQFEENQDTVHLTCLDWQRGENVLNTTEDNIFVNPDTSPVIKINTNNFGAGDVVNGNIPTGGIATTPYFLGVSKTKDTTTRANIIINDETSIFIEDREDYEGNLFEPKLSIYLHTPIFIPPGIKVGGENTLLKNLPFTMNSDNS